MTIVYLEPLPQAPKVSRVVGSKSYPNFIQESASFSQHLSLLLSFLSLFIYLFALYSLYFILFFKYILLYEYISYEETERNYLGIKY